MIRKGKGGANTLTGLIFEKGRDIASVIKKVKGYSVQGNTIFYNKKEVAKSYKKNRWYVYLKSQNVDYKKILEAVTAR